ncbi:hypothetical protein [Actinomycetospora sp.]|jgi:hypothetical protein|uniref:hypothetical protein n=1 Tax=Actinomycetospora sp. TaxID=1872135 RepID=UPI002F426670
MEADHASGATAMTSTERQTAGDLTARLDRLPRRAVIAQVTPRARNRALEDVSP